jgi:hypothetical protein
MGQLVQALGEDDSEGSSPIPGDIDGNGSIEVLDLAALINGIVNGTTADLDQQRADCVPDNKINVRDITEMVRLLLANDIVIDNTFMNEGTTDAPECTRTVSVYSPHTWAGYSELAHEADRKLEKGFPPTDGFGPGYLSLSVKELDLLLEEGEEIVLDTAEEASRLTGPACTICFTAKMLYINGSQKDFSLSHGTITIHTLPRLHHIGQGDHYSATISELVLEEVDPEGNKVENGEVLCFPHLSLGHWML